MNLTNVELKNLKKLIGIKNIKNKDFVSFENKFMEEDLVYNSISEDYDIININNFNILVDIKK